jgi:glucose-1-phosphate thymidylyltransferase
MSTSQYVKRGVVLAAGDGSRFGEITATFPKVLLPVRDKPLIWHSIEALVAGGIREIAVVVGFAAAQVKQALGDGSRFGARLEYLVNHDYMGGNAISVERVNPWVKGEPFVLCMGDHIIESSFVSRLLNIALVKETLCVDFAPGSHHELTEATKVVVDEAKCIRDIGKELDYWDGIDTGVFLLTQRFLDAAGELIPKFGIQVEISDVIKLLVSKSSRFATCDVSGSFWADVDTEDDRALLQT